MRVVYIPDVGETYGAANSFKEMVSSLHNNHGVEPVILTSQEGILTKFARENNFETHAIGHKAFLVSSGSTPVRKLIKKSLKPYYSRQYQKADIQAVAEAENYIDFSKVDLIHTNVNRNDVGALLAAKYHVPHVWHIREFGDSDYDCFSLRKDYIDFMNHHASRFIAVSGAVKDHWARKGLKRNQIEVVYNGVDADRFDIRRDKKDTGKIRMIFSGAIIPSKGQMQVIQALAGLESELKKKIKLDIYGTGAKEYLWKLNRIIKANDLEQCVEFKGYCDHLYEKVNSYDIGFVCSKSEGFGRVTVEYMMSGLCVIASDTGANPELVKDSVNGMIYHYNNINDLRSKIRKAINDMDEVKKLSENAYAFSKETFTAANNAANIYKIYESVWKQNQGSRL